MLANLTFDNDKFCLQKYCGTVKSPTLILMGTHDPTCSYEQVLELVSGFSQTSFVLLCGWVQRGHCDLHVETDIVPALKQFIHSTKYEKDPAQMTLVHKVCDADLSLFRQHKKIN